MAFYLKYRPQKLADLDLPEVRGGISRVLSAEDIPHAFLFAGPRGTGKTSAARIVAKAVNCSPLTSNPEPCNQCDSCLSITAGANLDILEIDGASNRGIDDIRSLREKIKLAPLKARYKVYIIDEAHMLTTEAFNALLKTLEEPPPHAIFILCTTEPQKLPATIVSRCLEFNFRKAKIEELVTGLEKIVKAEKLQVKAGVLTEIAAAAEGSFRDSQKVLEQLAAGKKTITRVMVNQVKGNVAGLSPEQLLHYLAKKETRSAIKEIGRAVEGGVNLRAYTQGLLELLRWQLLARLGVEVLEEQMANIKTALLTTEDIKELIDLFTRAAGELKIAVIPQLPLEMAIIEFCTKWGDGSGKKNFPSPFKNPASHLSPGTSSIDFDSLCQKWPQVLQAIGPKNHSIQAFLRATRPKEFDGETLILEVFYEFHKSQLESEKCRRVVEETAELILKTPVKLKCVLGEKPTPKTIEKSDLSSSPSQPSSPPNPPSPSPKQTQEEKYHLSLPSQPEVEDDIMKVAEEIFGTNAN